MEEWQTLARCIAVERPVLSGKPAIRGLRISVEQTLTALAGGSIAMLSNTGLRSDPRTSERLANGAVSDEGGTHRQGAGGMDNEWTASQTSMGVADS